MTALVEAERERLAVWFGVALGDIARVARHEQRDMWLVDFTDGTREVVTGRQLREHAPLGLDVPIVEWPAGVDRDGFVLLLSNCVDACAELGHDVPFDGPQLVAWLESPVRRERALASFHVNAMRQTLGEAKDRPRGRPW